MALDERYIPSSDLEGYFVDKDSGLPLSGGTLTFYRDSARNVPKQVFQLTGSPPNYTYTALPNPVELSSVGTPQNAGGDNIVIYYYPYDAEGNLDLYYVDVRDSDGIQQFTREAWPNVTTGNDPTRDPFPLQNQISNPQFTEVLINQNGTTTYSVTAATDQVFAFAPNWDFIISGTGTVIVERVAVSGNDNIATSPPYVLDVTVSAGVTECYLRQRFSTNSGLWASTDYEDIYLSGIIVARNENVGTTGLQMYYTESTGGTPELIVDESFDNSGYEVLTGQTATAIPLSTNTDTGEDGYIDIYISFLTNTHVRLSSIQVVPTLSSSGADLIQYDIQSSNREQALMGDYYLPRLKDKQIQSFLIGWDFRLNPAQFGSAGNLATNAAYILDQTIAARGATGNVAYTKNTVTGGLQFTTAGTNDYFYMMQYMIGFEAKKIINGRFSINVNAYKTAAGDDVTMRIYLIRGSSAATVPTLPTSLGTVSTSGEFTLTAANWTIVARGGLPTASANLSTVATSTDINNGQNDYGFSGWEITDGTEISDTNKFAVIVTFGYIDASTVITVESVSLVPGDIPSRPAIEDDESVLLKCMYYYEKSYAAGVNPGTFPAPGYQSAIMRPLDNGAGNHTIRAMFFSLPYKVNKVNSPIVTFYDPGTGTSGQVDAYVKSANVVVINTPVVFATYWTELGKTSRGASYEPNNTQTSMATVAGAANYDNAMILYHYTVDSRPGIV